MQEFRRKYKLNQKSVNSLEKPMMLIYFQEEFMAAYISEFKNALSENKQVFDVYYTGDK